MADKIEGPWRPANGDPEVPMLAPPEDPSIWCYKSGIGVANPALLPMPDGSFNLYFKAKSINKKAMSMGVAIADKLEGPYVIQKEPITANDRSIEDGYAFIWRSRICLMTTDNHGMLEKGGGLLWTSKDGIHFSGKPFSGFHNLKKFYLKGNVPKVAIKHYNQFVKFERPQILLGEDGEPEYLYCPSGAALDGSDGTNGYILRRRVKKQ